MDWVFVMLCREWLEGMQDEFPRDEDRSVHKYSLRSPAKTYPSAAGVPWKAVREQMWYAVDYTKTSLA